MVGRVSLGIIVLCAVLAWVVAERSGERSSERTAYAQEDCTVVETFGPETEDQITDPIQIEGNTIRLTADLRSLGQIDPFLTVFLNDEQGLFSDSAIFTAEGTQTENFLAGPGAFTMEIEADETEYTLTVEDCGSSPTGGAAGRRTQQQTTPQQRTSQQPKRTTPQRDGLMDAGGPVNGPVPLKSDGKCPKELPLKQGNGCYSR